MVKIGTAIISAWSLTSWSWVRIPPLPPLFASVAQLVERNLAKVDVDGSSPFTRSSYMKEMVMENKEIFNKVAKLIEDVSGKHRNEILMTHTFDNDLYLDSLDHVELIMYVEEEFGLEIADNDAEKIETVKDLVEYLEKHI